MVNSNFRADRISQAEKETLGDEIDREDTSGLAEQGSQISLLNELVAQYLAHDGYIETAKAFATEVCTSARLLRPGTTSTGLDYKEDLDAINRQR